MNKKAKKELGVTTLGSVKTEMAKEWKTGGRTNTAALHYCRHSLTICRKRLVDCGVQQAAHEDLRNTFRLHYVINAVGDD